MNIYNNILFVYHNSANSVFGSELSSFCTEHRYVISDIFNVYMDGLSDILCRTECGCTVGGRMITHLVYANDLVILSPSAKGLQRLVDICAAYCDIHDTKFNHTKIVCMYLPSKGNCTLRPNSPLISLNLQKVSFVPQFKYLG